MKRLFFVLLVLTVFVDVNLFAQPEDFRKRHEMMEKKRKEIQKRRVEKLAEILNLTEEQKKEIEKILDEGWQKITEIRRKMRKMIRKVRREIDEEIEEVLNEEQIKKYREHKKEIKKRMKRKKMKKRIMRKMKRFDEN